MPVTSLIMVRFSIRKKFWKALDLLYQMAVETTGKQREETTETTRGKRRKRRGNHGLVCGLNNRGCPPWCRGFQYHECHGKRQGGNGNGENQTRNDGDTWKQWNACNFLNNVVKSFGKLLIFSIKWQ